MMYSLPNVYKGVLTFLTVESSLAVFAVYFVWSADLLVIPQFKIVAKTMKELVTF